MILKEYDIYFCKFSVVDNHDVEYELFLPAFCP